MAEQLRPPSIFSVAALHTACETFSITRRSAPEAAGLCAWTAAFISVASLQTAGVCSTHHQPSALVAAGSPRKPGSPLFLVASLQTAPRGRYATRPACAPSGMLQAQWEDGARDYRRRWGAQRQNHKTLSAWSASPGMAGGGNVAALHTSERKRKRRTV